MEDKYILPLNLRKTLINIGYKNNPQLLCFILNIIITYDEAFDFLREKGYNKSIIYDIEKNKYYFQYCYLNNSYIKSDDLYDDYHVAKNNCLITILKEIEK